MAEDPAKSDRDAFEGASVAELTTEIVSAYVAHNSLATSDLARLIGVVAAELRAVGHTPDPAPAKAEPAVPVRRSIQRDRLTCLVCGKRQKMLRRHLGVAHDLTPGEYRARFGLKPDYPMVAPSYSEERAELARKIGLGGLRKRRAARRRPPCQTALRQPSEHCRSAALGLPLRPLRLTAAATEVARLNPEDRPGLPPADRAALGTGLLPAPPARGQPLRHHRFHLSHWRSSHTIARPTGRRRKGTSCASSKAPSGTIQIPRIGRMLSRPPMMRMIPSGMRTQRNEGSLSQQHKTRSGDRAAPFRADRTDDQVCSASRSAAACSCSEETDDGTSRMFGSRHYCGLALRRRGRAGSSSAVSVSFSSSVFARRSSSARARAGCRAPSDRRVDPLAHRDVDLARGVLAEAPAAALDRQAEEGPRSVS